MNKTINWGIIATGRIAKKFAHDLNKISDANLIAVGSRSLEKAEAFGKEFKADRCYGSYEELAADPDVDVVYIGSPHPFHYENTLLCLKNGKAVLCEKPLAMNKNQVKEMIQTAKDANLFFMEALWTRFLPATEKVLEIIADKSLGELVSVDADFGFEADKDPNGRWINKSLGGGSLLDLGIYPIYLSLLTMGKPDSVAASADFFETEVDASCSVTFNYRDGKSAQLNSSLVKETPTEALLTFTNGSIRMHSQFHNCAKLTVTQGSLTKELDLPFEGIGYYHEILEVNNCLRKGVLESEKMSHAMSWELISMLDRVRDEIGLEY